jgi:hypothetical protein
MKRVAAVVVLALLFLCGAAPGASASVHLTGSTPDQDARVATAPTRITLAFDEPVDPDLVVIFVTGADGIAWTGGDITAKGDTVTIQVTPAGPAGTCVVRYSVAPATAGEDPLQGRLTFTLTKAVPAAPHAAAAVHASVPQAQRPVVTAWKLVALAAGTVAVAIVTTLALLLRRPRGRRAPLRH